MKLIIETPTKLRVLTDSNDELNKLKQSLTYKNTSIAYQIKMTKDAAARYGQDWAANKVFELEQKLHETILYQDKQGYYTRPGLLTYIKNRFDNLEIENLVQYPEFKLIPWAKAPDFEPHEWQKEAMQKLVNANHAHIEACTGAGKSYIIELLAKQTGLPTVISTPSVGIARSLYKECIALFGKQKVGLLGDKKREIGKHILIAINRSLSMLSDPEELEQVKKYKVLIIDESHLLPTDQLDRVCNETLGHCPYRWFVSGTQERTDGRDLKLLSIIGPQVFNYPIEDAINDGTLAKLHFMVFDVESKKYFESNNLIRMNQEHIYNNHRIAQAISDLAKQAVENNMPVLILVDEHVQEKILQGYMKVDYTYACGKTKTHEICEDFNAGKIMCIVGNSAVSIGTNFKPVRLTINWQAGKSSIKFRQGVIGRSTRIDKRTGKTDCNIVYFRIVNVPVLKRHGNEVIKIFKEIADSYSIPEQVQFVNFEEVFTQMNSTSSN